MAAPLGNQNAVKGRRWSKAIERAVDAWPERAISLEINKGLDKMAYEFVARMVETKDIAFYREFGDRIDGKAPQAIVGDDELPPVIRGVVTLVKPEGGSGGEGE
jgi:hypothetical protein